MSDWIYEKIENHTEKALSRFTEQYGDAENLKNLLKLWSDRAQVLENTLWDLLRQRTLEFSFGRQLDLLGQIIGERRFGRNDSEYRSAIQLKIFLNRASGDPETILTFLRSLADSIFLKEIFPATLEIFLNKVVTEKDFISIKGIMPVGVKLLFLGGSSDPNLIPFGIKESGLAEPEDRKGFGELISSEFFGVDGGFLVELFGV